ncbi:mitochondrial potassium channel ATP-binding subunit [Phlebotomus argentipes]|uniref:mitochondrial potassium channel ATP-binding subunit n=1 Tax=Phlebotomus argentipes TaxID=94469 RepID=UPI002892CC20|nr:mitochondrial potassium channel ATP-binding subunit [Phlebotomus argentipes]
MYLLLRNSLCREIKSLRTTLLRSRVNLCKKTRAAEKSSIPRLAYGVTLGGGTFLSLHCLRTGQVNVKCQAAAPVQQIPHQFDWRRLWSYLRPHFLKLLGAVISAIVVAYLNIKIPIFLGVFVNTLSKYAGIGGATVKTTLGEFLADIRRPGFHLFSLYGLQSLFTFFYIILLSQIGEDMAAQIKQDLYRQIIVQDLAFFDRNRTGELVNRLTTDVHDFKSSFKQCISQGLRCAAQLIGGGISLVAISPHMAGVALISVPSVVLMFSMLGQSLRALSKKTLAQTEKATAVCEEALSNIRTVRSNASEYQEAEVFERETNEAATLAQNLGSGIAVFQALTNFMLNGMVASTLLCGGYLMSTNQLTAGQLMAFLVAAQGVQRSLTQGSLLLGSVIRGMAAGTRVFDYLAISPQVHLERGLSIPSDVLKGHIRFHGVSFAYPTRAEQTVLKDFCLTLEPGKTVALVGASGSGKSTVAALLERFYEPSSGTIELDGFQLSDISPMWLRGHVIGFIEQQPILFATSIFDNIKYGRPDATDDEVFEAARLAQCHDFIRDLPDSYDTHVGERGVQLSGGQRQRIAIARALLKKPTVLILDEATSALDATSEAEVQKALDQAVQNRTTLVIAHRLSTIRNADLIVVLNHGRIVEMGTHEQLTAKRGLYYALVSHQSEEARQRG